MKATDCSQDQARSALCDAISDDVIEIRAKLRKHQIRPTTSTQVVGKKQLRIPTDLTPEDFDWEKSRPFKPWFLRDVPRHHHGPWQLASVEVSSRSVTEQILPQIGPTMSPSPRGSENQPKRKLRENPKRTAAKKAIDALWPNGVPPAHELPNDLLDRQLNSWLKRQRGFEVSRDTALRAAGRRK
ncbi:hypothetical protein HZZ13_25840 [Bradyrhizobium sp. CNPSo 4010]|uniref:Uncharacterized protein n=1 Tax=Bradyrhizobium agreste TaxID=2751811 RepID=A0ABS0PWH0_9BRAD|nr:hypothetical protein [Bradyrhizobium agreste]MBH5401179.1 hypothetical protein [Bradyrhizobium agreste]